jgi:cell wall-associated NlpC family hydrolase
LESGDRPIEAQMPSIAARIGLGRLALVAAAGVVALVVLGLTAGGKSARHHDAAQRVVSLDAGSLAAGDTASAGVTDTEADQAFVEDRSDVHHRKALAPSASATSAPSPGIPTDAEVRAALKQLKKGIEGGIAGVRAVLGADGLAKIPRGAPDAVKRVIAGGNEIAKFPYIWGGGHGSFQDNGYDCSGSVSYALAAGGLLKAPMTSGAFANWGKPGPGKWITIVANGGHVYMYVAGLRFDTSGRSGPRGSRWQTAQRSNAGFAVRHPPGL